MQANVVELSSKVEQLRSELMHEKQRNNTIQSTSGAKCMNACRSVVTERCERASHRDRLFTTRTCKGEASASGDVTAGCCMHQEEVFPPFFRLLQVAAMHAELLQVYEWLQNKRGREANALLRNYGSR